MKKLLSAFIIVTLIITISFTFAYASVTLTEDTVNTATYKIFFNNDENITTLQKNSIIESLDSSVLQTVFTLNLGDDVYTIGYYNPDGSYSYEKMETAVRNELNILKEDIKQRGEYSFDFNDLKIKEIELSTKNNAETIARLSENLESSSYTMYRSDLYSNNEVALMNESKIATSLNGIDGSYHFTEAASTGNTLITRWYNHLTNTRSTCNATLTDPHKGDGNNRYDSGYNWYPNQVRAEFDTDVTPGYNRSKLSYIYYTDHYNNLIIDDNEALEMEIVYYNLKFVDDPVNVGNSFQQTYDRTWSTNQPNAYLDTNFGGDIEKPSFCVGVDDASDLEIQTWYYWSITSSAGEPSSGDQDGRFKVNAQRSYKHILNGAYGVFMEVHEGVRTLGVPERKNWVVNSAYYYAETDTIWTFLAGIDNVQ